MVDIQSPTGEIRRGKKERKKKKKPQDENIYGLPYYIGRPKKSEITGQNKDTFNGIFPSQAGGGRVKFIVRSRIGLHVPHERVTTPGHIIYEVGRSSSSNVN